LSFSCGVSPDYLTRSFRLDCKIAAEIGTLVTAGCQVERNFFGQFAIAEKYVHPVNDCLKDLEAVRRLF
jgi:hypothetical protein